MQSKVSSFIYIAQLLFQIFYQRNSQQPTKEQDNSVAKGQGSKGLPSEDRFTMCLELSVWPILGGGENPSLLKEKQRT